MDGNDKDIEVELSAQELRTLSGRQATPARSPSSRPSSRIVLLGSVAITSVMGLLVYLAASSEAPTVRVAATPAPIRAAAPVTNALPARVNDGPPVRYVNPFDRSEVFEFPPGTTRAAAHDAVAELLLERARGRIRTGHLRAVALATHARRHGNLNAERQPDSARL
jgi:hypothetical protein